MWDWFKFRVLRNPRNGYQSHPTNCSQPHLEDSCDYNCHECGEWIGLVTGPGGPC